MRITFEMSHEAATKATHQIAKDAHEKSICDHSKIVEAERRINDAIQTFSESEPTIHDFPGGQFSTGNDMAVLFLEDEAAVEIVKFAFTFANLALPVISVGKAALSTLRAVRENLRGIGIRFKNEWLEKFGEPYTYATTVIRSDDLGVYGVITVRDDGFDNWSIQHLRLAGTPLDTANPKAIDDICMRLFENAVRARDVDFVEMTEHQVEQQHDEMWFKMKDELHGCWRNYLGYADADDDESNDDDINVDDEDDLLGCDADNKIPVYPHGEEQYALVIAAIDNDARRYAYLISGDIYVNVAQLSQGSCYTPIDYNKMDELIHAMIRQGKIKYNFSTREDAEDILTIMKNDRTFYQHQADARVQFITMRDMYKNDEDSKTEE